MDQCEYLVLYFVDVYYIFFFYNNNNNNNINYYLVVIVYLDKYNKIPPPSYFSLFTLK